MNKALRILQVPTAPYFENLAMKFIENWVQRLRGKVSIDRHSNLVACFGPKSSRKSIAFAVHTDHPGFKVVKVKGKGIESLFLGGVPQSYFKRGTPVELFDRTGNTVGVAVVDKVLTWKPPKDKRILLRLKSGTADHSTFGMWKLIPLAVNKPGTHVVARACDDLAGCAAVLAMLENLSKLKLRNRVYAIFTRREEIGLKGAFELAKTKLIPKSVPIISIETSKELPNAKQGDGPIARVGDRTSIFDPSLTQRICSIGESLRKKKGFIFQRKLMDGGTCEATAFLSSGYTATGMCVALGNYHNCDQKDKIAAENIHLGDWKNLVTWMTEIVQRV